MNTAATMTLFDFMYSVTHRLLVAASRLSAEDFRSSAAPTRRGLRATLVHELDVEWSWRLSLQRRPLKEYGEDAELDPADFADVASLRERWASDEREMRAWLLSLSDEELNSEVHPELGDRPRPLWNYLVHIVMHARQQQSDAATVLALAGHSVGTIDFLEYLASETAP